jgi:hypothetical protein
MGWRLARLFRVHAGLRKIVSKSPSRANYVKRSFFVDKLAQGVAMIAAAFHPKDVTGEFCDIFDVRASTLVTRALGAALAFAARLAVRASVLLRLHAPVDAAGEFVLRLARALIIHFLAAEMTARKRSAALNRSAILGFVVLHNSPHAARVARTARFTAAFTS